MKLLPRLFSLFLLLFGAVDAAAMPLLLYRAPGEQQALGNPQYYFDWSHGTWYGSNGIPNLGVGTNVNQRNASVMQEAYSGAAANTLFTQACGGTALTKVTTQYQLRVTPGCGLWTEGTTSCTTGTCIAGGTGNSIDNTNFVWYNRDWTCAGNCAGNAPNNTWTATNATVAKDQTGADGTSNAATSVLATAANGKVCAPVPIPPNNATLASGGAESGYVANELITLNDSCATHSVIKVLTVSSGHISTFRFNSLGSCATLPANPVSQLSTSGSGTGATFNLLWQKLAQSAYIKRITGSGTVNLSPDDSTYTDFSGSINNSTYTWVKIPPVTAPTTPQFCLKLGTNTDKVAIDLAQMENTDIGATSPIVTTNGTNLRGDEMPAFNTPSGSPVMQNAGYRFIQDVYQGRPFSLLVVYSGNFSPSLSHLILGTDGSASVIPFATGAAGGGIISVGGPGGTFTSTGTDTSGIGTVNKVLLSCYGGGCKICVNGVGPDKSATVHAQYNAAAGNLTHAGQLNNGSALLPTNGYEIGWYAWLREVTDYECKYYSTVGNSFLQY